MRRAASETALAIGQHSVPRSSPAGEGTRRSSQRGQVSVRDGAGLDNFTDRRPVKCGCVAAAGHRGRPGGAACSRVDSSWRVDQAEATRTRTDATLAEPALPSDRDSEPARVIVCLRMGCARFQTRCPAPRRRRARIACHVTLLQ